MLPDPDDRAETPDVEDTHDDDKGTEGHEVPGADEDLGVDGDGDEGGGESDDDADDAAGTDDGQARQSDQVERQSRGNRQFGELRRERRELREQNETLQRRLDALENRSRQQDPAVAAAERRAKLELMTPEERAEFLVDETRRETRTEIQQVRFELADGRDAARYDALCSRNPVFERLRDRVEKTLLELRRNGGTSNRETVAKYLIGEDAVNAAEKQGGKQREAAQRRIQKQTAKPVRGASDKPGGNERRGVDDRGKRAERLKDVLI